jgi:hypothetical protein
MRSRRRWRRMAWENCEKQRRGNSRGTTKDGRVIDQKKGGYDGGCV